MGPVKRDPKPLVTPMKGRLSAMTGTENIRGEKYTGMIGKSLPVNYNTGVDEGSNQHTTKEWSS